MKIPFPNKARQEYFALLNEVFDSNFWSEGGMLAAFESEFAEFTGLPSRAVCNGGAGLYAVLEYAGVQGGEVIVPANTFWATARAVEMAGAKAVFADCNREDLCLSLSDLKQKVTPNTKAAILVHIGGHLAFESHEISEFCRERDIVLLEDCAHAHGADWNGKTGGAFGLAGVYSFYATKTMPTGEGGMVVSRDQKFIDWLSKYRNYGKKVVDGRVTYPLKNGFNFRMNEVTAALGLVQLRNLPEVLDWKRRLAAKYDEIFERKVEFPQGMTSGYYKYIVFDYPKLAIATGQVFGEGDLGPEISGRPAEVPNSYWVAANHQCPPIYYGWEQAGLSSQEISRLLLPNQ